VKEANDGSACTDDQNGEDDAVKHAKDNHGPDTVNEGGFNGSGHASIETENRYLNERGRGEVVELNGHGYLTSQ
jgi:hypothetical protein